VLVLVYSSGGQPFAEGVGNTNSIGRYRLCWDST